MTMKKHLRVWGEDDGPSFSLSLIHIIQCTISLSFCLAGPEDRGDIHMVRESVRGGGHTHW